MAFVSGLFLAAGLSSRYGGQKLLLQLPGGSVCGSSLRNLLQSSVDEIIIVTGDDPFVLRELQHAAGVSANKKVAFVKNPRPERGMASSAKIGVEASDGHADGYLFMLADLAFVTSYFINRILEDFTRNPELNVVPYFAGRRGHPVLISSRWKQEFWTDRGDFGGRNIIARHPGESKRIDFLSGLPAFDIDRLEDYRNALQDWGRRDEAVLRDILGSRPQRCISISGGGGKTSCMVYIADLLSRAGRSVCMTTTTKLRSPETSLYGADRVIREDGNAGDAGGLPEAGPVPDPSAEIEPGTKVLWLGERVPNKEKYRGPGIDTLREIFHRNSFDDVLIEADGSAGKPLKVPGVNEPVIPDFVNLYIALVGLSSLGKQADSTVVHRLECLHKIAPGEPVITGELIEMLIDHPEGFFKNAPLGCEKLLICNQCDVLPESKLRELVRRLPERVSVPDYIAFTRMEPEPMILAVREPVRT